MGILTTGVRLTKRGLVVNIILHITFLMWYYVFPLSVLPHVLGSSTETYLLIYAAYNVVMAITSILFSFYIHKFDKLSIMYRCSVAIPIVVLSLLLTSNTSLRLVIIFIQGIFFSAGQLASFSYFWSLTEPEERGRVAGLLGFFALPFSYFMGLIGQVLDFTMTVLLSAIPCLGIFVIGLLKPKEKVLTTKTVEKECFPETRTILLYSIPWILFSIVNSTIARNISLSTFQSVPSSIYMSLMVLQIITASFGALGGGIIADFFGRKLSLSISLTLYGICIAIGGFVTTVEGLFFTYAVNGLTWGILWVLYGSVVWGDLANKESYVKRYASGLIIFYISMSIGYFFSSPISQIPLTISSLVGCSLIFLSNVPLFLAPEILSSDFREKIKMKLYLNIIKKIGQRRPKNQG